MHRIPLHLTFIHALLLGTHVYGKHTRELTMIGIGHNAMVPNGSWEYRSGNFFYFLGNKIRVQLFIITEFLDIHPRHLLIAKVEHVARI